MSTRGPLTIEEEFRAAGVPEEDIQVSLMNLEFSIRDAVQLLAEACHEDNKTWWFDPRTGEPLQRNKGEQIALIHSEVSEALEGVRKNLQDDHCPEFTSEEVEMADALIRIFDYAHGHRLRLADAFIAKRRYNAFRADHKPEARIKENGKSF